MQLVSYTWEATGKTPEGEIFKLDGIGSFVVEDTSTNDGGVAFPRAYEAVNSYFYATFAQESEHWAEVSITIKEMTTQNLFSSS
jgi:hypothetical protein